MPQFQNNFYGVMDYHDDQLAHYGLKTTRCSDDIPARTPPPVYELDGMKTVKSLGTGQYKAYRDPSRVLQMPQRHAELKLKLSECPPTDVIDVKGMDTIGAANSVEPKPSLVRRMLKRRLSIDSDNRSAKRVKTESRDDPGYRKKIIKRARDFVAIVSATQQERQQYEQQFKHSLDEKREEERRKHPEQRPAYQQAYLVEKQKHMFPGTAFEALGPQNYPALVEEHKFEVRLRAGSQADYQNRYQSSMATDAELLPVEGPVLQLNSIERAQARTEAYEMEGRMPEEYHLSATQKLAMGISKILDPLKKNQVDDKMDIFDSSPPEGMMEVCGKCHEPARTYLIDGVCQLCHAHLRRPH